MNVTAFATWAAGDASVATFSTSPAGLATAVAAGTTQVTAILGGIVGATNLTVTNGIALVATPASNHLAVGNATAVSVVELLPNNTTQPVTGTVTWDSATPSQANVIQYGANGGAIVAAFASSGSSAVSIAATEGALTGITTITVDQGTTKYAYVSDNANGAIDSYTVNVTSAPYLTPSSPLGTPTEGFFPSQTVVDPNGHYLFSVGINNGGTATVATPYTVAPSGALTTGTSVTVVSSPDSTYSLVDPYGRFLFVADQSAGSSAGIYVFAIDQTTGALTPVSGSPFTANVDGLCGLVVDFSGTYLYASNAGASTGYVSAYQINSSTGALTALSPAMVTAAPP